MSGGPSDMPVSDISFSLDNIGSPTVKRAPVTYGRSRHGTAEGGTGSKSYPITGNIYNSICISENIKEQVKTKLSLVPSEAECADDEREDENEQRDMSPKITFGWKQRLRELDNEDEFTMSTLDDNVVMERQFGETGAEVDVISLKGSPGPLNSRGKLTLTDNTLRASPSHSPARSPVNSRGSSPFTPDREKARWRASRRSDARVSDSESEPFQDRLGSSTHTSPPLIFQTPNTRSSPTPPTSDDEMPPGPTSKRKGEEGSVTRRSAHSLSTSTDKHKAMKRMKAPTKMELAETVKDRARLVADQDVSIPKAEHSRKFTLHTFFADIGGVPAMEVKQPSDPILPFSSSPSRQAESPTQEQGTSRRKTPELQMVSVAKEKLQARKQQVLALQSLLPSSADVDDDDDLEIVADSTPSVKGLHVTAHKKQKSRFRRASGLAKPSALLRSKGAIQKSVDKDKQVLTQGELSVFLAEKVIEQNKQSINKKETEWVKRGGQLKTYLEQEDPDMLSTYVRKGLQNSIKEFKANTEDDETEQSAEEFGHGSKSLPGDNEDIPSQGTGNSDDFQAEALPTDEEVGEAPRFKKRNRHAAAIIDSDSDSENERHDEATSTGREIGAIHFGPSSLGCLVATDENGSLLASSSLGVVHRRSVSSLDDLAEDRSDKENNQKLAFDRSEDKENNVVARHEMSSLSGLSSTGITGNRINNVISPGSSTKEGVIENEDDQRSPLTVLSEDKSKALQPESSWTNMFASRPGVLEAYFSSPEVTSHNQEKHVPGIVQLEGVPSLQPAFADLFESGTLKADSPLVKQRTGSVTSGLQREADLKLTQDILLQPAVDIGNQTLHKADSIFEKEQLILLEEANKKAQKKQFYVNDFGFLTQTRPSDEDFELYKSPLVTQKTSHDALLCSSAKDSQRRPLSTLSFSMPTIADDQDDLADAPRRRLMKRRTPSPSPTTPAIDPDSPTPASRQINNAFDILNLGYKSLNDEKTKNMRRKSELVVAEAEESDDDDVFGFGIERKDDDDDDDEDEDLDRTLETLVDDHEMDADTLAAGRVIEKFKEHADHDDQELEKLHQAAVRGELRRKRRNRGIGLDDSDEESDEDERNRRIRRRMNKRQRIDRDSIKALAVNEETKSFYQVYKHDLFDDDIELGYLQQQDVDMIDPTNDPSNGEKTTRKYVTREEINQQVRELARKKEAEPGLDPRDVSWIDDDPSDEEGDIKVKVLCLSEKKDGVGQPNVLDDEGFGFNSRSVTHEGEAEKRRLESWAKIEHKRNTGTGRSGGGVAVTGHGKTTMKTSGRVQESFPSDDPLARRNAHRNPLKATSSMLAGVSDRSTRFG